MGGVFVRFTSNFCLADETVIDRILTSGLDEITISLNSIDPEEYQIIMGLNYDNTIRNVKMLIQKKCEYKSNLKIVFSIVLREDNEWMLDKFREKYERYGEIRVIRLGKWIGKDNPEQYDDNVKSSRKYCQTLYKTINFLSNGDFALCCFDSEGIIHKNILNESIMDVWRNGRFRELRKLHKKLGLPIRNVRIAVFDKGRL